MQVRLSTAQLEARFGQAALPGPYKWQGLHAQLEAMVSVQAWAGLHRIAKCTWGLKGPSDEACSLQARRPGRTHRATQEKMEPQAS